MWHDAHNHLQDSLLDNWREDFLRSRAELGIGWQVVNATHEGDFDAVDKISRTHAKILPCYGIHPWHVQSVSDGWKEALAKRWDQGGAVGEIGLDRWKTTDNFQDQMTVFQWQWEQAVIRESPATVHCLRAWGALIECIRENPHQSPGFLLHAYGGPTEMVREWIELGAYFSFSGSFLNPGRERKLEPFRVIPSERLLLETDAPAMPLAEVQTGVPDVCSENGERVHHPANLPGTGRALAKLRGQDAAELAEQMEENFSRLFRVAADGIAHPTPSPERSRQQP